MLKIGVFDSGLGGLTVVKALQEVIKGAELFYVADTKNAPYGDKTSKEILQYSLDITQYFIREHDIDALIIACNTATSAAIEALRTTYPELIIIGTEPGIKPAMEKTHTGKVGVLATPATLQGEKYQQLSELLSKQKNVTLFEQACPGLVEQIEKGEGSSTKTKEMLEGWLAPMRENNVDTIVLGCTHYPLVCDEIEEVMACKLTLIHTGGAIAGRLLELSKDTEHENSGDMAIHLMHTGSIREDIIAKLLVNYNCIIQININKK